ncbi:M3 family oligoendopeptidase, partial [Rhodopirellula bahusiensis]
MNAPAATKLPTRDEVAASDCWDLSSLYESQEGWQADFDTLTSKIDTFETYRGRLGESAQVIREFLDFDGEFDRIAERCGTYAFLRTTENQSDSDHQARKSRFQNLAVKASQASSFVRPELLSIEPEKMESFLNDPVLEPYKLLLERIVRYRPHTLTDREERLLAMQGEMAGAAGNAFRQLNDADLRFGELENEDGQRMELSHATFIQFLHSTDRDVRKKAFDQYYQVFSEHENTLAATLAGSIHRDVYYARARNYESSLESSLFPDNMPVSVYDNLIQAVRDSLPAVHEYLDVRRRKMNLPDMHHYDTYVPILSGIKKHHTWDQAVNVVLESLQPLGQEYVSTLEEGLRGRWSDRYPNRGKQSGAFSCGSFDGDPFILMNFKEEVLND